MDVHTRHACCRIEAPDLSGPISMIIYILNKKNMRQTSMYELNQYTKQNNKTCIEKKKQTKTIIRIRFELSRLLSPL